MSLEITKISFKWRQPRYEYVGNMIWTLSYRNNRHQIGISFELQSVIGGSMAWCTGQMKICVLDIYSLIHPTNFKEPIVEVEIDWRYIVHALFPPTISRSQHKQCNPHTSCSVFSDVVTRQQDNTRQCGSWYAVASIDVSCDGYKPLYGYTFLQFMATGLRMRL